MISQTAVIGQLVRFEDPASCWIEDDVEICDRAFIGRNVRLNRGVRIYPEARIEDNCIIGYAHLTNKRHEIPGTTVIGQHAHLRPGCQVYQGCTIGDASFLNHGVMLREQTHVGHHSSIGSLCWCEGYSTFGNYTTIHAQCHLTAKMTVGDFVFMGPGCTTANAMDITHRRQNLVANAIELGPIIEFGVRIGSQVMLSPGKRIGREAMVGMGSLVTKDVEPFSIVIGRPARKVGDVPETHRFVPGQDFPADHPILSGGYRAIQR